MAPTDSLRERKKQRTSAAIRDAALSLFADRGFDAVTMTEVAEASDVSPRTLFRYFPDKEELVFGDDHVVHRQLLDALAALPRHHHPMRAAREAVLTLAPLWQDRHAEGRARQVVIEASPALRARERAKHAAHEQMIGAGLAERDVDEDTARLLARITVACFHEAVRRWLRQDDPTRPDLLATATAVFDELGDLILDDR